MVKATGTRMTEIRHGNTDAMAALRVSWTVAAATNDIARLTTIATASHHEWSNCFESSAPRTTMTQIMSVDTISHSEIKVWWGIR